MAMNDKRLNQMVRSILGAEEREIVCSEFFDRLPAYVDLVLEREQGGKDTDAARDAVMHDVVHHMAQCPECAEACEALLAVTRAAE